MITNRAFTLIELLVVITIIVVLLALLTPALDKAIYQAELTQCGAGNLKSMGVGVTTYAMDNKRYYPDREIPAGDVTLPINPFTLRRASIQYDIRSRLKKIFSLNKTLQCPLAPQVDLEEEDPLEQAEGYGASYAMYFGWQFKEKKDASKSWAGMFKIGDRLTYDDLLSPDPNGVVRLSVLGGDIDLCWGAEGGPQSSHPDREPSVLYPFTAVNQVFIDGRITLGIWMAAQGVLNRGLLDTNYVFADGSVGRYNGVTRVDLGRNHPQRDRRMARVPINFNNHNDRPPGGGRDKIHLPRQ